MAAREYKYSIYGISQESTRVAPIRALYEVAVARLEIADRVAVVTRLAAYIEEGRREGRFVSTIAFGPAIHLDPYTKVVSTAALSAAALMGSDSNDPIAGPKHVYATALEVVDQQRRTAILSGLVALGDPETLSLLRGCWAKVSEDCRKQLSCVVGGLPYLSIVDFLLTWAEDAVDTGDEGEMARALGTLGHVARVARGDSAGPYSGQGIHVFRRNFPAWAVPATDVVRLERSMFVDEVARTIEPRLRALASREQEVPSIAAATMEEWGL